MSRYNFIDIFAGCGGLEDGFLQTDKYNDIAAVEWLKPQVNTLRNRLKTKWEINDSDNRVIHFDIQRETELFQGWDNDPDYGQHCGLDNLIDKNAGIDLIIGGPPCQAYSVAGRVRDKNGMKDDYRNYLFEHYCSIVNRYKPKLFVFENVPGILSAKPDGTPITEHIRKGFSDIGYEIIDNLSLAKIDASNFAVPQKRERVVIVGLSKKDYKKPQLSLNRFYKEILPKYKNSKILTVKEAIDDLPDIMPFLDEEHHKKHIGYTTPECSITWHEARYQNLRDMDTFRILAEDVASGKFEYDSKKITELYEQKIGSKSPIHRYHVLEPNKPSTTIIAHLYKDGNRFIHYDPKQSRSITVREAARLQSFDDDFNFVGNRGNAYQMIGNAVPPKLAKAIGNAIFDLLEEAKNVSL